MVWARSSSSGEQGFSLIEVLISIGLLLAASAGIAQLFGVATTANMRARGETAASVLAVQKMEQLRGLTWGFDQDPEALGLPLSDTTTDLSVDPPTATGRGLNPSPGGTLETNTPGYVDYLDQDGTWIGTGATPPAGTYFIRRWAVQPLPTNPNNTLIFTVLVTTHAREARLDTSGGRGRQPGDAWLVSVKTRKAR